ncbi:hypothetical protein [Nannocystis pusilla]|uniref:hypothetical protein n=1 Tax=Nannocystis pusilla TaxID=889268 RepID=UPI003DA2A9D6
MAKSKTTKPKTSGKATTSKATTSKATTGKATAKKTTAKKTTAKKTTARKTAESPPTDEVLSEIEDNLISYAYNKNSPATDREGQAWRKVAFDPAAALPWIRGRRSPSSVASLTKASLPSLQELHLGFGVEDDEAMYPSLVWPPKTLQPLLAGEALPGLRRLGLWPMPEDDGLFKLARASPLARRVKIELLSVDDDLEADTDAYTL